MNLATQTSYTADFFGLKNSIEMIKEAGFDSVDFSMFCMSDNDNILNSDDYVVYVKKIKAFAKEKNIPFSQAHAPFSFSLSKGEDAFINTVKERVTRAIIIAEMLEIPVIVVHPLQFRPYYKKKNQIFFREFNKKYYEEYLPLCEKTGVKIACENIWKTKGKGKRKHIIDGACADPEEYIDLIDSVNSKYFTGCLDLGHCGLTGRNASDCLRTIGGDRITALHVHDNDNISDVHTAPGYGKMDWDEIAHALADINYKGNITFEADEFIAPFEDDYDSALCALKLLNSIGRNFIRKIESYK